MEEQDVSDSAAIVEEIKAGGLDGQLVEILEAVRLRFLHGSTQQRWKVTYDGAEIVQDSLTLAEAAFVERTVGTSWAHINPVNSAGECQAIIAMHLHLREGMKRADAVAQAGKMNLEDAVAAVSSYEVERAPKDSAA